MCGFDFSRMSPCFIHSFTWEGLLLCAASNKESIMMQKFSYHVGCIFSHFLVYYCHSMYIPRFEVAASTRTTIQGEGDLHPNPEPFTQA